MRALRKLSIKHLLCMAWYPAQLLLPRLKLAPHITYVIYYEYCAEMSAWLNFFHCSTLCQFTSILLPQHLCSCPDFMSTLHLLLLNNMLQVAFLVMLLTFILIFLFLFWHFLQRCHFHSQFQVLIETFRGYF